jgi:hypothetical protein
MIPAACRLRFPQGYNQASDAAIANDMKLRNYESETTKFIRDFLEQHPQVVEKQKRNRATWWDRPQNLDERKKLEEAKIAQQGYVYYNKP